MKHQKAGLQVYEIKYMYMYIVVTHNYIQLLTEFE